MVDGVPVYESVREAARTHGVDASVVFVPAPSAKDSALEALEAGVPLVVIVTEGVPVHDAMTIIQYSKVNGRKGHRPQLPRTDGPGRGQAGHNAQRDLQGGQHRAWFPAAGP